MNKDIVAKQKEAVATKAAYSKAKMQADMWLARFDTELQTYDWGRIPRIQGTLRSLSDKLADAVSTAFAADFLTMDVAAVRHKYGYAWGSELVAFNKIMEQVSAIDKHLLKIVATESAIAG